MVSDRALIFYSNIPCGKTLSLVRRSRSLVIVKVIYQGHIKNMALVFHKDSTSKCFDEMFLMSTDVTQSGFTNSISHGIFHWSISNVDTWRLLITCFVCLVILVMY